MGKGAVALQAVGTIMQYQAQQQQADATELAAKFNAREKERYAKQVMEQAAKDEANFRRSFAQQEGANIAAVGASGIGMSGSALDVLRQNAILMEEDAANIQENARAEAAGLKRQAEFERYSGRQMARGIRRGATASLLTGGAQTLASADRAGMFKGSGSSGGES